MPPSLTFTMTAPAPSALADPLDVAEALRLEAAPRLLRECRRERGQFLSAAPVARLLASMLALDMPEVSLLDAGAGVGSLFAAVVSRLCRSDNPPDSIYVVAQNILKRRALSGQHPSGPEQIMDWLEATARAWNREPTPFVWGGARHLRRERARQRRHALGDSGACTLSPVARPRRKGYAHAK